MYKIIKTNVEKKDSDLVSQLSGYCILRLIGNSINEEKIDNDLLISEVFIDYDYDTNSNRISNQEYIKHAKECKQEMFGERNV